LLLEPHLATDFLDGGALEGEAGAKRCKKAAVVANRRRPSIPANSMRKAGFLLHLESFVLADKFELGFMESLEA
jgi:hypothetical protein